MPERNMADQPVTREKLINADKDVQVIEDFIKKPKDETVTTRFGDEIMTLKGLEEEVKKSGGYFKRYASLAAANADIANIPVNSVVKVTDAVDGGDYEKPTAGAATLTKSAYDPLTQSKKYTDEKTKFVSGYRGVNIADLSDALDGFYVSYEDGAIGANPEFILTNYLEISGGVEYKVPYNYNQQFAFYDENKAFISCLASANSERKFTTPSNAKYIRLSIRDEQVENFMLAKASEYPPIYTPYNINLKALKNQVC